MTTTCNLSALTALSNTCFIEGTQFGNRKTIAKTLAKCIHFKGGYRAAYREVKRGYITCNTFAGKMMNGRYGLNSWFA